MKTLQWSDNLSVGIELIDGQHKTWIEHFNTTAKAVAAQKGPTQTAMTLNFLREYTAEHFATEEKHMAASEYPAFATHKALHDELQQTLEDLVLEYEEEGATYVLADVLDTFLGNWLIQHIKEVDMLFGAFVKENGIVVAE
ncbi:MAG: hemerythrin family protein [Lentisphaeria bacterium]|nr:hemerythrin family protein [Lentisphaeria bacterium]